MKTHIGNEQCTRCGGGSNACPVCQPIEEMSAESIIGSYSDEALQGAIEQLRKADYLGKWGKDRLKILEDEARIRRKIYKQNTQPKP